MWGFPQDIKVIIRSDTIGGELVRLEDIPRIAA